jgi:hypothetical protein
MSLQVSIPHTRAFEGRFLDSMIQCAWPDEFYFDRIEGQSVATARNLLAAHVLQAPHKPDYMLMVDSDATWHPAAVERLMSRHLAMVTGCIYYRGLPPVPTWGRYTGKNQDGHHVYHFGWAIRQIMNQVRRQGLDTDTPNALCLPKSEHDLVEIDGCGMHFCLIRRDVLEAIEPPWFEAGSTLSGEDFYFCRKVRAAGFQIYADLSVHTGHIVGPGFDYGLRELLAYHQYTDQFPAEETWDVGGH